MYHLQFLRAVVLFAAVLMISGAHAFGSWSDVSSDKLYVVADEKECFKDATAAMPGNSGTEVDQFADVLCKARQQLLDARAAYEKVLSRLEKRLKKQTNPGLAMAMPKAAAAANSMVDQCIRLADVLNPEKGVMALIFGVSVRSKCYISTIGAVAYLAPQDPSSKEKSQPEKNLKSEKFPPIEI